MSQQTQTKIPLRTLDPAERAILQSNAISQEVAVEQRVDKVEKDYAYLSNQFGDVHRRLNAMRLRDGMASWFSENFGEATFFVAATIVVLAISATCSIYYLRPPRPVESTITQMCSTEAQAVVVITHDGQSQQLPLGSCATVASRPKVQPKPQEQK